MYPASMYIQGETKMFQWTIYQSPREQTPSSRLRKQQAVKFIFTALAPYVEYVP